MPYSQLLHRQDFGSPVPSNFRYILVIALVLCELKWGACVPEEEAQQRSLFSCFGSSSNLKFISNLV